MNYILYESSLYDNYVMLIRLLWPDIEDDEILDIINEHNDTSNKIFMATDNNKAVGFLNTSIRTDYVEGSDSSRTGYIEGIFVMEHYRKQNVATHLLNTAFEYFKSVGIKEVGSDVELDNKVSASFHEKVGFTESSRNIHYIMKLK